MIRIFLSIALAVCTLCTTGAAHTGRVFVDNNGNGVFDRGEKPMRGVRVSDGLMVVQTAADGSFSLPGHDRERFIFITTPSGYKTGNRHYLRIDADVASYDFGLQPWDGGIKRDGSHSWVHISDTEIFNTVNNDPWASNLRDYAANGQAAFIVHTGDLCYEKGLTAHIELMNTANMNCPVFYCIGNHDLVKGKYGEELFESLYGPVYYSFDAGSTHYIVTPMLRGDHRPGYTKEDVYRWLVNDLARVPRGMPVIVFNHDLLTTCDQFIYGIGAGQQIDLGEYNLKAWVYGHWHMNYIKKQGDVYSVCTTALDKGGIDHSTGAFRVMHMDRTGNFTSELRYTYLDKSIRISSPTGRHAPVSSSGTLPLTVNAYSSVSGVKEMYYSCLADGENILSGRALDRATDWSWRAEIPVAAAQMGSMVNLRVKAVFDNGEVAITETVFTPRRANVEVNLTEDWCNLLGNPRHAAATTSSLCPPLRLAWVNNIGANIFMTAPLVYGGRIYVASVDENLRGDAHIYALDGRTGRLVWQYRTRNSIKNTIVIDSGRVLAQDAQGYLYAVDAKSGELCWEKQLPVEGLPALVEGLVTSDGVVYAGTGKGLCAVSVEDGREIWRNRDWTQGEGTTSTFSVAKNTLIASSQWQALYGNDLNTGELRWTADADGLRHRGASAAVHGDLLYLISEKSFFIMNVDTGQVIVRRELPFSVDVTSTPLLTENEIVFGSVGDGLIALDRETLGIRWRFSTPDALVYTAPYSRPVSATIETSPVLSGDTIWFGSSDGTIYGVDRESGMLVWKHETGAPIFGSIAVSGNALIAVDFGGNVYAFASE